MSVRDGANVPMRQYVLTFVDLAPKRLVKGHFPQRFRPFLHGFVQRFNDIHHALDVVLACEGRGVGGYWSSIGVVE
jgi:hypothetical protein